MGAVKFARAVSRHRVRGQPVQAVFGLPRLGLEAGKLELNRETDAAGLLNFFDVGVDAGGEGFEDFFRVGRIALIFSVHVAAIPQKAGTDVALHVRRSEDFRKPALAGAFP